MIPITFGLSYAKTVLMRFDTKRFKGAQSPLLVATFSSLTSERNLNESNLHILL